VIAATSSLLNQSLSPTNLIDAIWDKVDQKAIKNPKSKRDDHDAAFVAGPSKKGNGGLKKSKKDIECYNCHKKGHFKLDCWAPGGGVEGKGPKKWQGKQKEMVVKTEMKDDKDMDAVWRRMCKCGWQISEMVISRCWMSRKVLERAGRMIFLAPKLTLTACTVLQICKGP
jgi:hypothetical protein